MIKKIAKIIRIISIAPVMALLLILSLKFGYPGFFGKGWLFPILALFFICIVPVSAYPLQRFFPKYREKGREGQRELAIVFVNISYPVGLLLAIILGGNNTTIMFFLTYFLSGFLMILFNRIFHIRTSGHLCGVGGPMAYMIWFLGNWAWFGLPFYLLVCWASHVLGRHTTSEMIMGTLLSVGSMFLSIAICGLF